MRTISKSISDILTVVIDGDALLTMMLKLD